MEADNIELVKFLRNKQQLIIPIYQRPYSWGEGQCTQLWNDIENAISNKNKQHFIGSIVRVKSENNDVVEKLSIIDGQQRLTTILLLIIAIINSPKSETRKEELMEDFLINRHQEGLLKYKMLLTEHDRDSMITLIENYENKTITSKRIKENYEFFQEKIEKNNPETIWNSIRRLEIIDIVLDTRDDEPQAIFESINATGLKLTPTDLIRNFLLMGLEEKIQEEVYKNYWREIEKTFQITEKYSEIFNRFMHDYLTMKTKEIIKEDKVYEKYKEYFSKKKDTPEIFKKHMGDMLKFSKYYVNIALDKEENKKLKQAFKQINAINITVIYSFLLEIYDDYKQNIIDEKILLAVLNLVENYLYRRAFCNYNSNSLSKIFPFLAAEINKNEGQDTYIESLQVALIFKEGRSIFPTNTELTTTLLTQKLSTNKNLYWMNRLENDNRKEYVEINDYTIEHIMPKTIEPSKDWGKAWIKDLGENWRDIHETYLNTLGNLTLTGYNSKYSNRPFLEKKNMENGFVDSPLKLNKSVAKHEIWNEASIKERALTLINYISEIWSYPKLQNEVLQKYKEKKEKSKEKLYTLEDYKFLQQNKNLKELFETAKTKILNLGETTEECTKSYIVYKAPTNFVCIIPQQNTLRMFLNIPYEKIHDPKTMCRDVSDIGHPGTGDVEIYLSSASELEDVMALIQQAYDEQVDM